MSCSPDEPKIDVPCLVFRNVRLNNLNYNVVVYAAKNIGHTVLSNDPLREWSLYFGAELIMFQFV